eukprot:20369-Prymnesium_polylepis.1
MANAPRRSRWFSRLSSRAHRPHCSHEPSAQSSGGPPEAHEASRGRRAARAGSCATRGWAVAPPALRRGRG